MVLLSHSQMHWSCAPPALGYRPHHYYVWCVSILMDSILSPEMGDPSIGHPEDDHGGDLIHWHIW